MTTAQEIAHIREAQALRTHALREQGYVIQSLQEWHHDHVYLPLMTQLVADMRERGLLPKEPL